jgi:hypothetical protein
MADPTATAAVSDRAAVLAEMASMAAAPAEQAAPAEAAPAEAAEPEPAADEAANDNAAPVEAAPVETADPETAKRLATVKAQEKRQREQIAKDRADALAQVEVRRKEIEAEWSPKIEAAQKFEALAKRAKYDPAAVLEQLGLTSDDFELAARHLYARSKAGQADPKNRAAAEQATREREQLDRITAHERKLADLEAKLTAKEQAQAFESQRGQYLDLTIKAVANDNAPLLAKLASKDPSKARAALWRTAEQLFDQTGEFPDSDDVITAWETQRRAELEDLGIDVTTSTKPAAPAAPRPGKTLSNGHGAAPANSNAPKTRQEEREEVLREMARGLPD